MAGWASEGGEGVSVLKLLIQAVRIVRRGVVEFTRVQDADVDVLCPDAANRIFGGGVAPIIRAARRGHGRLVALLLANGKAVMMTSGSALYYGVLVAGASIAHAGCDVVRLLAQSWPQSDIIHVFRGCPIRQMFGASIDAHERCERCGAAAACAEWSAAGDVVCLQHSAGSCANR